MNVWDMYIYRTENEEPVLSTKKDWGIFIALSLPRNALLKAPNAL
jgi:hypothetical protein